MEKCLDTDTMTYVRAGMVGDKMTIIDKDGFRLNVGIIVMNEQGKLLWAKRANFADSWQFPQGGIHAGESAQQAMFRELKEELGLLPSHVKCLGHTIGWLSYRLPKGLIRWESLPLCVGQKQKWFLLKLMKDDYCVCLDAAEKPEFDAWQWVDYWHPLKHVISFKRTVYQQVLCYFESLVDGEICSSGY